MFLQQVWIHVVFPQHCILLSTWLTSPSHQLYGKDLDKLEKLSKLEHTPYSKIKRGIKRLKGVQEEGPKKISD